MLGRLFHAISLSRPSTYMYDVEITLKYLPFPAITEHEKRTAVLFY